MATRSRQELFTETVAAGSRTYFFDVKETQDGVKYLVISELRGSGEKSRHERVMVFEEHLEAFSTGFQKALECLLLSSVQGVAGNDDGYSKTK
ncbi:MAG: DUF3276 family protein [Thermodesulfobacteriota bacterium]